MTKRIIAIVLGALLAYVVCGLNAISIFTSSAVVYASFMSLLFCVFLEERAWSEENHSFKTAIKKFTKNDYARYALFLALDLTGTYAIKTFSRPAEIISVILAVALISLHYLKYKSLKVKVNL